MDRLYKSKTNSAASVLNFTSPPSFSFFFFFSSDKYVTDAQNLHEHVMRHNHGRDDNGTSINCLKIGFDTEYPL